MLNDGNNTLTYDAENRALTSSGALGSATYTYDGNGLRVEKSGSNGSTIYIFSGAKVIAEYAPSAQPSSPTTEYIYGGAELVASVTSGTTTYYHPDQLSNRALTNSTGSVVGQQGSYPFGESWYAVNTTTKWFFTSYERDPESANDYAMARYDVNRLGRFNSPDPIAGSISDPQTLNRYAYAHNDPINLVDPLGLETCITTTWGYTEVVDGVLKSYTYQTTECYEGGGDDGDDGGGGDGGDDGAGNAGGGSGGGGGPQKPNCKPKPASTKQYAEATAEVALLTAEFFSGLGSTNQTFGPNTATSQVMAQSAGVQDALNDYTMLGQPNGLYTFGLAGLAEAGANPVAQFLGSFRWSITPASGGINLTVTNTTSFKSLTYDKGGQWQRNSSFPTPMGNIHQTINIFIPCP